MTAVLIVLGVVVVIGSLIAYLEISFNRLHRERLNRRGGKR